MSSNGRHTISGGRAITIAATTTNHSQIIVQTYIFPCIVFMASAPAFMAFMASKFTLAFSMAITCVSNVIRAPMIFSTCAEYAFFLFNAISAAELGGYRVIRMMR